MSIDLDWEVSDAPDPTDSNKHALASGGRPALPPVGPEGEPRPTRQVIAAPAAPAPRRVRRMLPLLLLAVLAGTAGFGAWAITRVGWQRVSDDVAALVRYEDQFARRGDAGLVLNVQDPGNRDWLDVRRSELERHLAAPLPAPQLQPVVAEPEIGGLEALGTDFVVAEVVRAYHAPDGQRLSFALPQVYYRAGPAEWQRSAPPGEFWGEWTDWRGPLLHVRHSARDQALVAAIGPRLEAYLVEACALWMGPCDSVLPARLYLSGYVGSLEYDPLASVEVRVEFGEGPGALPPDYFLSVPSPQIAGIPRDAAGEAYLVDYLAVRVIASLAERASGEPGEAARLAAWAIRVLNLGRVDPGFAELDAAQAGLSLPVSAPATAAPATIQRPATTPTYRVYTVAAGDTLLAIAGQHGVSVEAIVRLNGLSDANLIFEGNRLLIPAP
jgi:hypothetical protein